ncbi:hypothetical protein GCM10022265_06510 [Marinobacter xestospongiae]
MLLEAGFLYTFLFLAVTPGNTVTAALHPLGITALLAVVLKSRRDDSELVGGFKVKAERGELCQGAGRPGSGRPRGWELTRGSLVAFLAGDAQALATLPQ